MKHHKPLPINRRDIKAPGWKREPWVGFVIPRLNPSRDLTHAVGFTASEYVEYDGEEDRKRQ